MYQAAGRRVLEEWSKVSLIVQFLFALGLGVSVAIFAAGSRMLGVPAYSGFGGSLLVETGAIGSFVVVAAGLLVCVLVGTIIAGWIRFDAGLWCAAGGLAGISLRAGTVGDVLRETAPAGSTFVLMQMGLELALLFALLGLAWSMLWMLHRGGWLKAEELEDAVEEEIIREPIWEKWAALGLQAAVMAICMMVLGQSDSKMQSLAAVGLSAFAGAWAATALYPVSPSAWIWSGPLVVGLVGYAGVYFGTPPVDEAWRTGQLRAVLAPLARALPLDYASMGPVGALLAYWMVRKRVEDRPAVETGPVAQPE